MADFTNKPETTPGDWQKQAEELRAQQKWDDLISLSSSVIPALKTNEDKAFAHFVRGYAHSQKGEYDRAIADFNQAIELNPNLVAAYNNRGSVYNAKGEYDHAIADCDKAIELNPDDALAYNNRGCAYNKKGEHDRAIADFNKAIELKLDYAAAYNNRGGIYNAKGEYDHAIADCDKAIELNPDYATAYNNRGYAYNEKGEHNRAIADYDKAIELMPDDAATYNNRGYAYGEKGEHDRAIADYNKAIELNPNDATAYNNRGGAYNEKGDYDRAIADCYKAIELKPDYAEAYNNRGYAYAAKGEHEKALADWEKAVKLAPRQNPALVDNLLAGIKALAAMRQQLSKKVSAELELVDGFERRHEEHDKAQKRAGARLDYVLGALFGFYLLAFVVIGVFLYCKAGEITPSDILPWIPVVFLTSSPAIWAARILNRDKTRHFVLRENAYANKLMTLSLSVEPRDEYQKELLKKLFDHHHLRGSPQLVIDLENKPKTDDSVVHRAVNHFRQSIDKQGGGRGD